MNRSPRFRLLWICLPPISVLALGIILYRPLPPRQAAFTYPIWERLGIKVFASGDMQPAITLLSHAAARHDLQPESWIKLGDAYNLTGDPVNALGAWQNAGDTADALSRQFNLHRQSQDYPAAITDLRKLTALQPEEAGWVYQLGLLLAATQADQAIPYLERAAAYPGYQQGPALALKRRIQAVVPASQPAYTQLEAGRGLADLSEWELAAAAFQRASELRPDYVEAWAFLGEALQHLNIPEGKSSSPDGLDELKFALHLDPDSLSANLFLAIYLRRQEKFSQALEVLENLALRHPENAAIQIELGNTLAENHDLRTALSHFMRATELTPADPDSWLALAGFTVSSQYEVRQAGLPAARRLLLLTPADPAALDLMGQALLFLEDYLSAERFFLRTIQAAYAYAPAHLHLAQLYLLRGENAAARREVERVCELAPNSVEAEIARRLLVNTFP